MKPAWHGLVLCCLVTAFGLVACDGSSTPSDYPAETSEAVVGTPVLIFSTPETEPSFLQEDSQALAPDPETAATEDPSFDVRTPVLVFFTPETEAAASGEVPQSPATDVETAVIEGASPGSGTPALAFFTPTTGQADPQGIQLNAGTPAPQFTRVALPRIASATILPRPGRLPVTPRATTKTQSPPASDEGPIARWPKGWVLAVGGVVLLILAVWVFARRRS